MMAEINAYNDCRSVEDSNLIRKRDSRRQNSFNVRFGLISEEHGCGGGPSLNELSFLVESMVNSSLK